MLRKDDRILKAKRKITPMMQQWYEIKSKYKDYIILFRAGDFYETFNEDAEIASKVLNITLTSRNVGEKKYPLAGVPHHAVDAYIAKLVANGYKVAIVEQLEDPKTAKKVVKRGVVQLVTRGTITLPESLGKNQNFLVSITYEGKAYGLAALDLSTGEFLAAEFYSKNAKKELEIELTRLQPSEILVEESLWRDLDIFIDTSRTTLTFRETYYFDIEQGFEELCKLFNTLSLEGFGINDQSVAIGAAGSIIRYLKETQMQDTFPNITKITPISNQEIMMLDSYSIRSLELIQNLRDGTAYGTLLQTIDNCKTAIGSRLLTSWLLRPLLNVEKIEQRLDATEELVNNIIEREDLRDLLSKISDIERIIGRVCLGKCRPRELLALKTSLEVIPAINEILAKFNSALLKEIRENLDPLEEVVAIIGKAISDDAPASLKDGNVIKEGYSKELDELRAVSHGGKSFLASLEAREKRRTGIKNLKVRYNKVFGYYIEVPKGATDKVPSDYERKQTLVNAERYITKELKEYEEKILNAEEKIAELEEQLYNEILKQISDYTEQIQRDAYYCSVLDVLSAFAQNAAYNNYSKPVITNKQILEIKNGRHPVVERLLREGQFIPNDCYMDEDNHRIIIITGPNMGGKCVTADTYVFTNKGILPIIHFKPSKISEGSFQEIHVNILGKGGVATTSHFYYDGMKDTIRITTARGYSIEGTHNHPIFVRTKDGREVWKQLDKIEPDDYIIINRKNNLWGTETKLSYKIKSSQQIKKYPLPNEISEDLAYLIGLLLGNGTITDVDAYYLSTTDTEIGSEFERLNYALFGCEIKVKQNGLEYYVNSKYIRDFLYSIGLKYWQDHEKEIPEVILRAPKKIVTAMLKGLFKVNKTARKNLEKITLTTYSQKLGKQVQVILLNYGIISSLKTKETKNKQFTEVSITGIDAILFHREINFRLANKRDTLDLRQIYENHYYYDRISKIEESKAEVYDFTVPETHSFIGNGFINHNSTYLRQIALIVLLAQIGSFVPADEAKIGVVDRIFTRIGAHDILVEHRSTFLQEMYECANILNNATERSLIILDEVGRGTSTFDGVAIAWAITEYLHNNIGTICPRVLFATHYHELIELEELLPRVKNYHVAVKNINGDIHFLYKVKRHGIDESYGVHVAALAGLPRKVVERAQEILALLHERMREEEAKIEGEPKVRTETKPVVTKTARKKKLRQTTLLGEIVFQSARVAQSKANITPEETEKDTLLETIVSINPNKITPIEAINLLDQIVRKAKRLLKKRKKSNNGLSANE